MDSIHCRVCRTRVAFIEDLFVTVWPGGIFTRLVNVENVNYHESEIGKIIADTHCVQCGIMLGWKFITPHSMLFREGTFLLRLDWLSFWNEQVPNEQDLRMLLSKKEIELIKKELELIKMKKELIKVREERIKRQLIKMETTDQDGDGNEQVPNEQDLGTLLINMEIELTNREIELVNTRAELIKMKEELIKTETTDQDGDTTDQDGDATDQEGDVTDQDLGVNEQNTDQDLGTNEQDGGAV
ncbi:hypothetical protein KY289_028448 [Solanum tuberosum]|nr:hypothetical protein KY289_028448 [Solanum tuberosum]